MTPRPSLLFSSLLFSSLLFSALLFSSLLFSAVLFSSLLFSSLPFPSVPFRSLVSTSDWGPEVHRESNDRERRGETENIGCRERESSRNTSFYAVMGPLLSLLGRCCHSGKHVSQSPRSLRTWNTSRHNACLPIFIVFLIIRKLVL